MGVAVVVVVAVGRIVSGTVDDWGLLQLVQWSFTHCKLIEKISSTRDLSKMANLFFHKTPPDYSGVSCSSAKTCRANCPQDAATVPGLQGKGGRSEHRVHY
jgi:hypothetical protein